MASGWFCEHLWDHYQFSGDEKFLRETAYPLMRSAAHLGPPDSPWERVPMRLSTGVFGPGSRSQFAHYFEGESRIPVASIDDIRTVLGSLKPRSAVALQIERNGQLIFLSFELD